MLKMFVAQISAFLEPSATANATAEFTGFLCNTTFGAPLAILVVAAAVYYPQTLLE